MKKWLCRIGFHWWSDYFKMRFDNRGRCFAAHICKWCGVRSKDEVRWEEQER